MFLKRDMCMSVTTRRKKFDPGIFQMSLPSVVYLFIYLGFYVTFNTVQVISRWVDGRAEETST